MTFDTTGDDAPAPHVTLGIDIDDLGGSVRRIRVTHVRSGEEISRDVDFLEGEDERDAIAALLREMLRRHDPTSEG